MLASCSKRPAQGCEGASKRSMGLSLRRLPFDAAVDFIGGGFVGSRNGGRRDSSSASLWCVGGSS